MSLAMHKFDAYLAKSGYAISTRAAYCTALRCMLRRAGLRHEGELPESVEVVLRASRCLNDRTAYAHYLDWMELSGQATRWQVVALALPSAPRGPRPDYQRVGATSAVSEAIRTLTRAQKPSWATFEGIRPRVQDVVRLKWNGVEYVRMDEAPDKRQRVVVTGEREDGLPIRWLYEPECIEVLKKLAAWGTASGKFQLGVWMFPDGPGAANPMTKAAARGIARARWEAECSS